MTWSRMARFRTVRPLALVFGITLLAACGGTPTPKGLGHVTPVAVSELGQNEFPDDPLLSYTIRPNDTIGINVFREPDLTLQAVQVGADGTVSMPLVGNVKVGGLTVVQVADMLKSRLGSGYLRDPRVSVNMIKYGSYLVGVEGAVTNPGRYEFLPGTRLTGALTQAGGVTRIAKLGDVVIMRPDADGLTIAKYDYRAVNSGNMPDPVILPNDRIIVGTSGLAQGYQDFLRTVPVFTVFFRYFR